MIGRLHDISLRAKIMTGFVLIVLGGTTVSTLIGSRIIAKAMLNEALKRVGHGLEAASVMYGARLDVMGKSIVWAASAAKLVEATGPADKDRLAQVLSDLQKDNNLHFLSFVDAAGGRVIHGGGGERRPVVLAHPHADFVAGALEGRIVAGTGILEEEELRAENPALVRQALVESDGISGGGAAATRAVRSGMVLLAAAPVWAGQRLAGVLYGGILLNRNHEIVGQIKDVIYGGDQSINPEMGTVSIYLGEARIATSVMAGEAQRAAGATLSQDVVRAVLQEGQRWYGRDRVADGWDIAACDPVRDYKGRIVGILRVSTPEQPYLAVRTDMMLTFLVVAAGGVLVVLGLTYLITRSMIQPLEAMVTASNRIAAGDLDHAVNVRTSDEIGDLASSFNKMVASLKTMKLQLEEWGRTLEEKVHERTEELVEVQGQMAQSAKMASLGRLAAGVAHEINNPLGGILTFSMLALEDIGSDHPLRENLEIIVKQTLRCRETVKGLLDFARQSSPTASKTDINSVVDKTLSLLEGQSIFQNIRIQRRLAPGLVPAAIDAGQLQQVVVNIVLNAVDAMEECGTLTVETLPAPEKDGVMIRISDTGKGIPESILPYIFEPFFTTKKVGQGTGLGLSIVHGIVTRVGGKVEVQSTPEGAVFTVMFMRAQEEDKGAGNGSEPKDAGDSPGQPAGGG